MSRRAFTVPIMLLVITVLGSCTWALGPFNHMSIDGDRYALDDLYIEYFGRSADGDAHNLDLRFVSAGLTPSQNGYSGSGESLYIELWSRSQDPEGGTYTYSETHGAGTFSDAVARVGWTSGVGADEGYAVTAGQVHVRNTLGSGYVIKFDFRARDLLKGSSVDITGRFRGPETRRYDYSMSLSEHPIEQKRTRLR